MLTVRIPHRIQRAATTQVFSSKSNYGVRPNDNDEIYPSVNLLPPGLRL